VSKTTRGLKKILDEICQVGYATRKPSFGGGQNPLKSSFDDGLDAVAVPILATKGVLSCITLAWIRKAAPIKEIVDDYLEDLQTTAQDIATQFEK